MKKRKTGPTQPPSKVSSKTIKAISSVVNSRCTGAGEEEDRDEELIRPVEMDFVVVKEGLESTVNETQILDVQDLITEGIDAGDTRITVKDVIAYVVLKYDPDCDEDWTVPEPSLFHDLINRVDCRIRDAKMSCASAYRWANLWGRVGLLGLSPRNLDLLNQYREIIEAQILGNVRFTLFPKEGLNKRGNMSVLLRENFREYVPECRAQRLINLEIPVLVRSLKSSNVELG